MVKDPVLDVLGTINLAGLQLTEYLWSFYIFGNQSNIFFKEAPVCVKVIF